VLRDVPGRAALDLAYHLTSPVLLLVASCLTLSFLVSVAAALAFLVGGQNPVGWWLLTTYVLSFGPALVYSTVVYWPRERAEGISLLRCCWLGHLYVLYGLMWYAAGWWAVARIARGQHGWAKTERAAEPALTSGATG
jgi:hypothetical protein